MSGVRERSSYYRSIGDALQDPMVQCEASHGPHTRSYCKETPLIGSSHSHVSSTSSPMESMRDTADMVMHHQTIAQHCAFAPTKPARVGAKETSPCERLMDGADHAAGSLCCCSS